MDDVRDFPTRIMYRGEATLVICFDFSGDPAVTGGATIGTPVVAIIDGATLVTLGTPTVLTSDFEQLDDNGLVNAIVPTGKGVKVTVTPLSTKGQCTVLCTVVASDGQRPGQGVFIKVK